MKWLALVLVLVLTAACHDADDDGPPCAKVMDHVLDLMKSTQGGHGGMNVGSRETMISTCEQHHMPKAVRSCMFNAKDITGLANCSRMNPNAPRPELRGSAMAPAMAPTMSPPPAPTPGSAGSGTPAP
ncbi:MAG TPA: hypothetical protein VH143_27510 [Kofleriaceae bacterium]|jgi:hypothetical protein|nr:hypothetical protein [Kofleriaceae bacterium]